jgi:hypothetical protein
MKVMIPRTRPSATAVPDKLDLRDEHIYSAGVFQHGGATPLTLFTVPLGQGIPHTAGAGVAATGEPSHYTSYTEQTTNLEKAGELGSNIGDAGVKAIGVTFDVATANVIGTVKAFGATPVEVADLQSRVTLEFLITRKRRIIGPVWMFPPTGGIWATATTFTAHPGFATNGASQTGRRFRVPIMIGSTDTVVAKLTPQSALVFTVTVTPGQPVLAWVNLLAAVGAEVR